MPKSRGDADTKNTHKVFKFMLLLAQSFAMFPVNGVTGHTSASLNFKWGSIKTIYNFIYLILLFMNASLYVVKILTLTLKFGYIGKFIFYISLYFFGLI